MGYHGTDMKHRLKEARLWAAEQECVIVLDGEVGFGRPCVGVMWRDHYVDTPGSEHNDFEGHSDEYLSRVRPPAHVDGYHKHDCLCVLGTDETSVCQLLDWIDDLRKHGATVRIEERRYSPSENNPFSLALHGLRRAVISFPDLPEDDKTVYYWEKPDRLSRG